MGLKKNIISDYFYIFEEVEDGTSAKKPNWDNIFLAFMIFCCLVAITVAIL